MSFILNSKTAIYIYFTFRPLAYPDSLFNLNNLIAAVSLKMFLLKFTHVNSLGSNKCIQEREQTRKTKSNRTICKLNAK